MKNKKGEIMEKKRSVGVTILAILMILDVLFSIFVSVYLTLWEGLILDCAIVICAIGLLLLKNWARIATILVYAIQGIMSVAGSFFISMALQQTEASSDISTNLAKYFLVGSGSFWGVVKFIIPLIFLTRPKVKEQFK